VPESERPILYDRRERIAWIRLNRPHRLNAVSEPLYEALEAAVADAEQDDGVRAIVVGGEGRAFCVGADLKAHRERERTAAERRAYAWAGQRACARLQDCPKPVVAAVNGYALGAGAEMALSCDFVVMAEEAEMGFPEVGLGTFLGGGLTYLLPKLVGLGKARELIMLGGRFTGRQAATLGLVMKAVPLAQLLSRKLDQPLTIAIPDPLGGPSVALGQIGDPEGHVVGRHYSTPVRLHAPNCHQTRTRDKPAVLRNATGRAGYTDMPQRCGSPNHETSEKRPQSARGFRGVLPCTG